MTVAQRIAAILTGQFGIPPEKIMPSATMQSLGLTDSLEQIEFGLELEIAFDGLDVQSPRLQLITTLGELEFEIERVIALGTQARAA